MATPITGKATPTTRHSPFPGWLILTTGSVAGLEPPAPELEDELLAPPPAPPAPLLLELVLLVLLVLVLLLVLPELALLALLVEELAPLLVFVDAPPPTPAKSLPPQAPASEPSTRRSEGLNHSVRLMKTSSGAHARSKSEGEAATSMRSQPKRCGHRAASQIERVEHNRPSGASPPASTSSVSARSLPCVTHAVTLVARIGHNPG